jgi:hypothetical protein
VLSLLLSLVLSSSAACGGRCKGRCRRGDCVVGFVVILRLGTA